MTDPNGRLADLARFVLAETLEICTDEETTPENRRRAHVMQTAALDAARWLGGFTEMPDAKRERLAS